MAYCTQTDIEKAFPSADLTALTDDEGDGSLVSTRVVDAIAQADAFIDTYLRAQHETLPLSSPPDEIKFASVKLAYIYLNQRRRGHSLDEGLEAMEKKIIKWLEMVANRKIFIDDADSFANTGGIFSSNKTSDSKIYTSDKMQQYTAFQ